MVFGSLGGLGGGCRDVLAPMLGDVGRKMCPRWVREGYESEFFAQLGAKMRFFRRTWRQDGKVKPPKIGSEGSGVEELERLGETWVGRRQRRDSARGGI